MDVLKQDTIVCMYTIQYKIKYIHYVLIFIVNEHKCK